MSADAVRALVENRLASIAARHRIKVLYACESGSRAWGFPSPDSDYDVRFLYVHPWDWYLSLEEGRDVIETPLEDTQAGVLDLGGWDLRKALRLARKSNPAVWEWLQSPIVYQAFPAECLREIRQTLDPFYSPITACHHYLGLARGTMQRELAGESVKIKKYFYMLRPMLAAAWIERHRTVPPMEFAPLLDLLENQPGIKQDIAELLALKQQTDEQIPIKRMAAIDSFLADELARLAQATQTLPAAKADNAQLDGLFRWLILAEAL